MNPPAALQGAMGRERKPFTYTPGGLDLSEIKSERMAKRLMRNAMNQGVPELPPQQLQSPSTPIAPIAVPNFNCLPVQVFPSINLPANPKSLLRTRSTPDKPRESPAPRDPPPTPNTNSYRPSGIEQLRETIYNNAPSFVPVNNNRPLPVYEYNNSRPLSTHQSDKYCQEHTTNQNNNNRPNSMYEFNTPSVPDPVPSLPRTSYGSNAYTTPVFPEISYDAQYCTTAPRNNSGFESVKFDAPLSKNLEPITEKENLEPITNDVFTIKPLSETICVPANVETIPIEDHEGTNDDNDQTVKVVKKLVKKKVENEAQQNGDQNGDAEAEMVVKLPAKKSAAKTETKVEVVTKTLPDGSVEETKKTITKTTVDGKTSISTKTETQIIPKTEEEYEEVEEEEEEEEEGDVVVEEVEENGEQEEPTATVDVKKTITQATPAVKESVVKTEEKSETTTTKKVVIIQSKEEETEEEEEEVEEEEEIEEESTPVVIKKQEVVQQQESKEEKQQLAQDNQEQKVAKEEKLEVEKDIEKVVQAEEVKQTKIEETAEPIKQSEPEPEEEEVIEEEEQFEEAEEPEDKPVPQAEAPAKPTKETTDEADESEYTEEEVEEEVEKEESPKEEVAPIPAPTPVAPTNEPAPATVIAPTAAPELAPVSSQEPEAPITIPVKVEVQPEGKKEPAPQPEQKVPLREPSIPLEKVEEVEIKPIGAASESISKTHTERTEIITSSGEKPSGIHSTQTEYNRIENIVTVNRTTKTLDHSYEQITQQGIPTVKTYFPPGRERVSISPSRPYQPLYTPPAQQPQTERRHSLLLERLSTERQMPSDIYQKSYQQQYNNQNYEQQRQWSQEPQSEVVNDSNIKPSSITNQQWYQQSRKENVIFNNVLPSTPAVPSQQWSQPQPQSQSQPPIQSQHQPPPHYQQQYQTSYTENSLHDTSKISSNSYQQSSYPYTPTPTNWASSNVGNTLPSVNNQPNQCSYLNQTSTENYQNTSQQYSSSYVPPPWEQDPSYVAPKLELSSQTLYQPNQQTSTNTFSTSAAPGWKPTPPAGKFSKPVSKSYIPPAPNQSFVKAANLPEPQHRPGSKTYYSEYERRYITVPESTYIPADATFQAQPDPSPQYYYDNNEPSENLEPEWRKELREFTEKTQTQTQVHTQQQVQTQQVQTQHQTQQIQSQQFEQTSVNPPWEVDAKYSKVPTVTYTPTPSWSQTLRPQSGRERSFESEYVNSNEWSKTNTLGRGRPLSSYANTNVEASTPKRARGVSVDRYNPNKYQSPLTIPYDSEHSPVQAHTLDPTPSPHRGYHNPNVPAYHVRSSAEPREQQSAIPTARNWGDSRTTPLQSRSFKYLQWITGTED